MRILFVRFDREDEEELDINLLEETPKDVEYLSIYNGII